MENFVKFVEAVAWPLIVFLAIYKFKDEIKLLLTNLAHAQLKFKDFEVVLKKELSEAERSIREISARRLTKNEQQSEVEIPYISEEKLSLLAETSPRAAILESWLGVEKTINDVAKLLPITEPERRTVYKHMLDFKRRNLIDPDIVDSFHQLSRMRNQIAHVPDFVVSPEEAERYVGAAKGLIRILKLLPEKRT